MPMDIEVFTGGCYLCRETVNLVKGVMGPRCTLKIYNLTKGEGKQKIEKYGIRAIPTIVGNGQKMFEGVPEHDALVKCSLEHGCKGQLLK